MNHNLPPREEGDKDKKPKRKLSKKQKLMGAGAVVATGAALFSSGVVGGGKSTEKLAQATPIELSQEQGQERFKQGWDSNEQDRLFSEGCDAATPEEALNILIERLGHDARALAVYGQLVNTTLSLEGSDLEKAGETNNMDLINDEAFIKSLVTPDGQYLSAKGQQLWQGVKDALTEDKTKYNGYNAATDSLEPDDFVNVTFIDFSKPDVDVTDLGDRYMTGMSTEHGFVHSSTPNTFGENTKAVRVGYGVKSGSVPTYAVGADISSSNYGEYSEAGITFTVSGCQPLLTSEAVNGGPNITPENDTAKQIPVGNTEAEAFAQSSQNVEVGE